MAKSNSEIVREQIEVVWNGQHYERVYDYISPDCVQHIPDYVGIGMVWDETNQDHHLYIVEVAPNGPAAGKLFVGDELVKVQDKEGIWDSYEDLKYKMFGQGVVGTTVTFTVRRNGQFEEIPLVRSLLTDRKLIFKETFSEESARANLKEWPDLVTRVDVIFEQGDLVACSCTNQGTNLRYGRSVSWGEMDIYRLKDGKIVEIWALTDDASMMRQLGYKITEPQLIKT